MYVKPTALAVLSANRKLSEPPWLGVVSRGETSRLHSLTRVGQSSMSVMVFRQLRSIPSKQVSI
jgi:hypothetical protein